MYIVFLETNPIAKKWRERKKIEIQHFEKLFDLFSKDMANGEGCIGSKEKNSSMRTGKRE